MHIATKARLRACTAPTRRALIDLLKSASWLAVVFGATLANAAGADRVDACRDVDAAAPRVRIDSAAGAIDIELYPDAAPQAVDTLLALLRADADGSGYYDGLSFDYTRPHSEIRSSKRRQPAVGIPAQLDAHMLGLDTQGPHDAGEAMEVMQRELIGVFRKDKHSDSLSPQLRQWLQQWYQRYDADFLIGVSRQQINEALGYAYTAGLHSRPVTAGSVALVPRGKRRASPRLSIVLRDQPGRTGRWMVVGRVVSGLDVAERISLAPLRSPAQAEPRDYTPTTPVVIDSARVVCNASSIPTSLIAGDQP
jgi:cyclophilin family peptidyl-prolyl cis-trans isomerase